MLIKDLINYWNHIPEHINPIFITIWHFQVRYYGLMYLVAFTITYFLVLSRIKKENFAFKKEIIDNYFIWAILSVLIGGRLGYTLFYNLSYYIKHPLEVILPFDVDNGFQYTGLYGMSYHGALITIVLTSIIFCLKYKLNFWSFADLLASVIPLGYTFGRLGNFINGELYGRITTMVWGMYFPLDRMHQLRHPSQLYEAFFEGLFLFVVLWSLRKKTSVPGVLFSLYLIGYGLIRFILEFFREPDQQLGFILWSFSMGQVLCFAMLLIGVITFTIRITKVKGHY